MRIYYTEEVVKMRVFIQRKNIQILKAEESQIREGIQLLIKSNRITVSKAKTISDISKKNNYSRSIVLKATD